MKKNQKVLIFVLIISATLVLGIGCEEGSADGDDTLMQEGEVRFYYTKDEGTSFIKQAEQRDLERVTPKELMEIYLEGPNRDDLFNSIPEETNLLGIEVEDEIAYIDFSSELLGVSLGHESEQVLIQSIVYTMTEFKGIGQVQILVEGEVVESISGHIEINKPLSRGD